MTSRVPTGQYVYLNGQFLPRAEATLDIEDRGVMFADGVYEVLRYYGGRALAMDRHVDRLRRSLREVELPEPDGLSQFDSISDELVARNASPDANVYWQVTRGPAPRNAKFPESVKPTVLLMTYAARPIEAPGEAPTLKAVLADDVRWHNVSVKSLMLLPNVLAHNRALRRGADLAIFHREGVVTEGSSTNIAIVRGAALWTHPADQWILGGVTRSLVLELARELGIEVREQTFTTEQLAAADEVVCCGTTTHVAAVTELEGKSIGHGGVGSVTRQLHRAFVEHVRQACELPLSPPEP